MANFDIAQGLVKISEGGFQKNPNDNGNWTRGKKGVGVLIGTNWGISAPTLGRYYGRVATEAEMRNLSYETAYEIYKKYYWGIIKGDLINNQKGALMN